MKSVVAPYWSSLRDAMPSVKHTYGLNIVERSVPGARCGLVGKYAESSSIYTHRMRDLEYWVNWREEFIIEGSE